MQRPNRKRPPSTPTPSGGGATLSGMTSTRNRAAKPADKPTDPEATGPEETEPEETDPEATDKLDLSKRTSGELRDFRRELLALVQSIDHELTTRPVDPTEVY